jgi:hypothetical protein
MNKGRRKSVVMQKIGLLVLCSILLFGMTGCGKGTDIHDQENNNEQEQSTTSQEVKVEIGAFVDYPVEYTNVTTNFNENITNLIDEETTGWRIMAINGDTITLISTGVPLTYGMYYSEENTEIEVNEDLGNLYKTLNTDTSYQSTGYSYFSKSGFKDGTFDLTTVFNTGLEDTTSIHAMTGEELVTLYNALTNKQITVEDLYTTTTYLGNGTLGLEKDDIACDLLANGYEYYINQTVEKQTGEYYLHYVSSGMLTSTRFSEKPLRVVLNLKAGVQLTDGDGSKENPYKISE